MIKMNLEKVTGTLRNYEIIGNQRGSGGSDIVGTLGVAVIIAGAVLGISIRSCMEDRQRATEEALRQNRIRMEHRETINNAVMYSGSPCIALRMLEEAQRKGESDYSAEIASRNEDVNNKGAMYSLGCSLGFDVDH